MLPTPQLQWLVITSSNFRAVEHGFMLTFHQCMAGSSGLGSSIVPPSLCVMPGQNLQLALAQRFCLPSRPRQGLKRPASEPRPASNGRPSKQRKLVGKNGPRSKVQSHGGKEPSSVGDMVEAMVGPATETTEEHLARHVGKHWLKRCARCRLD